MINIGVMGLGYVGLPLLVEFSKKYNSIGYDQDNKRILELNKNYDRTLQIKNKDLKQIIVSNSLDDLKKCNIYIVTVPTPIYKNKKPNLSYLVSASTKLSLILKKKDIVIFESTVFPGCTENICGKILEKKSKLKLNVDFFLGYSPERISPGETTRNIKNITKIVSGSTGAISVKVNKLYKSIIKRTYLAKNIKIAEAAKVIENTQRDLNIALVNELSKIFSKLNIETNEVLKAASTKWNFNTYSPGIVGGHCIGVDPYYLTYISKKNGYNPNVILAGRKINDGMGNYISSNFIKLLKKKKINKINNKILILGLTFKENCPDIRNSKVFDIIKNLENKKYQVDVYDPWVNAKTNNIQNIKLIKKIKLKYYDGIIYAVKHNCFKKLNNNIKNFCKKTNVIFDLKNSLKKNNRDFVL
jgi:UDP-N-acetyl-D-glucosamine/UDP-N-acetyl-D-galactosamine dehydrogenase